MLPIRKLRKVCWAPRSHQSKAHLPTPVNFKSSKDFLGFGKKMSQNLHLLLHLAAYYKRPSPDVLRFMFGRLKV